MKYKLVNNSSLFRERTLRKLIRFATHGMGPYFKTEPTIEVKEDCEEVRWDGTAIADEKIIICINPKNKYPFILESAWSPRAKYIDGVSIKDKCELFVYLLVHEATHLIQFNLKDPIIASNIIGLDEESQCDIVAMVVLNKWRRKLEKERARKKNL